MKRMLELLFCSVLSLGAIMVSACAGQSALSVSDSSNGPIAQAPEFKVGDNWMSDYSGRLLNARVDRIEDSRIHVCYYGSSGCDLYTQEGTWIKWTGAPYKVSGQQYVGTEAQPYTQFLNFPLFVGKSWSQLYTLYGNFSPASRALTVKVVAYEQVTTKAGDTFWAFRLEAVDAGFNSYHRTYWYAPSVRWIVKSTSDLPSWNSELTWTNVH